MTHGWDEFSTSLAQPVPRRESLWRLEFALAGVVRPSLMGKNTAAGCPAAAAVAAPSGRFAMPYHRSEGRGSTFFLVSIRIALVGLMVGLQGLDERVAKNRQILV
jgi:hypothetical protein